MNVPLIVSVAVALYFGYGIGTLNHDTDRHRWQISWLIGRTGHQETRLRRIEAALGITTVDEFTDPPSPPSLRSRIAARARAVRSTVRTAGQWLSQRAEPQPDTAATPSAEPRTEPLTQVAPEREPDAVDRQLANFDFAGGRRP